MSYLCERCTKMSTIARESSRPFAANRQHIANVFPTAHSLTFCRLGPTAHRFDWWRRQMLFATLGSNGIISRHMFLFGQFLPHLVRGQLEQLPEAQVREFQHSRRIRGTGLPDPVALGIGPLAGLGPAVRTSPGGEPVENFPDRHRIFGGHIQTSPGAILNWNHSIEQERSVGRSAGRPLAVAPPDPRSIVVTSEVAAKPRSGPPGTAGTGLPTGPEAAS